MYGKLIEQRLAKHERPSLGTASSIHDDVHLGQDPDFGSGSSLNHGIDPTQKLLVHRALARNPCPLLSTSRHLASCELRQLL